MEIQVRHEEHYWKHLHMNEKQSVGIRISYKSHKTIKTNQSESYATHTKVSMLRSSETDVWSWFPMFSLMIWKHAYF